MRLETCYQFASYIYAGRGTARDGKDKYRRIVFRIIFSSVANFGRVVDRALNLYCKVTKMKLSLLFVVLFVVFISNIECHWTPNIFESISNKTDNVVSFVKKETNLFKHKVSNYMKEARNLPSNVMNIIKKRKDMISDDIDDYLKSAQSSGKDIVNAISRIPYNISCDKDDPQVYLSTPQLIALNGYASESHTVKTEDGYILTLHRIPRGKLYTPSYVASRTVFLQHGLLASSADWVLSGPEKGLAYLLADAGFDVWLGNTRGNTYSKAHVSLSTESAEFWDFSFHEAAVNDLPAVIDYINDLKSMTNKIHYIGHSMGTTMLFVLLSMKPEYNKKMRSAYALAPVAYMSKIESPIKYIAPYANDIEVLIKLFGANEFLPQTAFLKWLSRQACEINNYEQAICENSMFVLCGYDNSQFNRTLLPIILGHTPAGASTKTLVHFAQEIDAKGKFQRFDYGAKENMKKYGLETPPEYNLTEITLPTALFSGENDWLSSIVDANRLFHTLPNAIDHFVVPLKNFNHIDFLWANDAPKLVYKKILHMLSPEDLFSPFSF